MIYNVQCIVCDFDPMTRTCRRCGIDQVTWTMLQGPEHHIITAAETKECDAETTIYEAELSLLRRVFETSSDLVKARYWEEFREACDGMAALEKAHEKAVHELEQWYSDGSE